MATDVLDNFGPMYSLKEFDKLREQYGLTNEPMN